MRAPALRFKDARHPTLNNNHRNVDRGNFKPLCFCCCRAGIEIPADKLRGVAPGHVKATLVRASILPRTQVSRGAESNLNSPTPRVRAIRQLPFRASVLSTVVRRCASTSVHKGQSCLSTVRCEIFYVGAGGPGRCCLCVVLS